MVTKLLSKSGKVVAFPGIWKALMRSVKKQNQTSGVKEKNYNQDNKSITELDIGTI